MGIQSQLLDLNLTRDVHLKEVEDITLNLDISTHRACQRTDIHHGNDIFVGVGKRKALDCAIKLKVHSRDIKPKVGIETARVVDQERNIKLIHLVAKR